MCIVPLSIILTKYSTRLGTGPWTLLHASTQLCTAGTVLFTAKPCTCRQRVLQKHKLANCISKDHCVYLIMLLDMYNMPKVALRPARQGHSSSFHSSNLWLFLIWRHPWRRRWQWLRWRWPNRFWWSFDSFIQHSLLLVIQLRDNECNDM